MDPNACFARFLNALRSFDRETALEAAANLHSWIGRGGFEPQWTSEERVRFMDWCRVNAIR